MTTGAQSSADDVKKEVFELLRTSARLDRSAEEQAEAIWESTLGNFFKNDVDSKSKWRIPAVRNYGLSAVRDMIAEAKRVSGSDAITSADLLRAAETIISKYRPPADINKGILSCDLCANFKHR